MSATPEIPLPELEYAFEIKVDVADGWHLGRGVDEKLWFTPVTGGVVEGPLLIGEVVPGSGGDWSVERSGTHQLEARYVLVASDGAHIDIHNRGYYRAPQWVVDTVTAGGHVDPSEYYFRCAPVFQTDAPEHRWLAENQFVGVARDEEGQIRIRIYVVR